MKLLIIALAAGSMAAWGQTTFKQDTVQGPLQIASSSQITIQCESSGPPSDAYHVKNCKLGDGVSLDQAVQSILDEMKRQNDGYAAEEKRLMTGWDDALKLAEKINASLFRCAGIRKKAKP